jgi:hypothetical protein
MYSYLKGIWWYDFLDDGADLSNVHQNFGLYDTGWEKKPAACAMGDIAKLLAGYVPISLNVDVRACGMRSTATARIRCCYVDADPGATVNAAGDDFGPERSFHQCPRICKAANVTGNDSSSLRAIISNSPTLFTTIADKRLDSVNAREGASAMTLMGSALEALGAGHEQLTDTPLPSMPARAWKLQHGRRTRPWESQPPPLR